jgi:hypothetical protein
MNNRHEEGRVSRKAGIAITVGTVAIGVMGFSNTARAALLAPGTTELPVTALGGIPPQDTTLLDSEIYPYTATDASNNPVFQGFIYSAVYLDPVEPDTGQPGLDFVYQVTNGAAPAGAPADSFTEVTLLPFSNYLTDVNYATVDQIGPGVDIAPTSADRSATPGENVDYYFSGGVANNQQTYTLLIETNAMTYAQGAGLVLDGGAGGQFALAPTVNMLTVPEPATLTVLLAAGTIALGRRRRSRC